MEEEQNNAEEDAVEEEETSEEDPHHLPGMGDPGRLLRRFEEFQQMLEIRRLGPPITTLGFLLKLVPHVFVIVGKQVPRPQGAAPRRNRKI